jgi:AhpD family alkylhydroperoxidase
MARLPIITYEKADQNTKTTYDAIESNFGMVPNIFKGMANSSVTLQAYLKLDELITGGNFAPVEQDIVRMVVSQTNGCDYCVAAHTIGLSSKGMDTKEILNIRNGTASDAKQSALVGFTL